MLRKLVSVLLCAALLAPNASFAGRRFNRNTAQVPSYIQTHTQPYWNRVAVVFHTDFMDNGLTDASVLALVKAYNTRLGAIWDELRDRGAEVHFYDTQTLQDSTSSLPDYAGEQGQPTWNYLGQEYPVVVMVGFRSNFEGTANDTRPWFKAYSTSAQIIHLSFNISSALRDLGGTAATANCGTGSQSSSFLTANSGARVCTYYGARDTVYGRNMSAVVCVGDSNRNQDVHSIVRLFKPVVWTGNTTGFVQTSDDSVAQKGEIIPLAYRVYWKAPQSQVQGRWVDYVLLGYTGDDERVNWQHIALGLIYRYTRIQSVPIGWIDADDNGNWGLNRDGYQTNTNKANWTSNLKWPTAARMDSIVQASNKWGVLWNFNGQFDSLAFYAKPTSQGGYGYNYLKRARWMSSHAHDTVNTHIYGNIFGKSSQNNDTTLSSYPGPRTTFLRHANWSNRATNDSTRNLGIYWRIRDHVSRVRSEFDASGGHYLNAPNGDGLPLGIRSFSGGPAYVNGNGNCPPDSFFLGLAYAGVHSVSAGFEFDYQADSSVVYYIHNAAKTGTGSPRKWFTWGDESWTLPAGADPDGRQHVAGEERRVESTAWGSLSEVGPQDVNTRMDNSGQYINNMLGLRRCTWMRPQVRYNLGETVIPTTSGNLLTRARNTAFNRVRVTNTHPRQNTSPGASNTLGDWSLIHASLNHLAVMDQLAGRSTYRFTTPWQTRQGPN